MSQNQQTEGELTIQALAMPADTNANGDIFGGWLLSQMDLSGAILARQEAKGRVATVAVNSMTFKLPVHVGDVLGCYAKLLKVGNTSITIKIAAWTTNPYSGFKHKVTEGIFTYVAIDEDRQPRPVKL